MDVLKQLERELKIRHYSSKTVKAYVGCVRRYLEFSGGDLSFGEDVKGFLEGLLEEGKAPETVNLYLNALKFFCKEVLERKWSVKIKFARRNKRLPVVLSREEIERILGVIKNRKHKLLVALAYGAGLRVSEVVKLRVQDVDVANLMLWVRCGKGGKDRISILPRKLLGALKIFCNGKDASEFVFESERGGALTSRTAQKVFGRALELASIRKGASFHSLRHSFATHLIENGVNLRYVQELLGHRDVRTTERYTQVARASLRSVQSPL